MGKTEGANRAICQHCPLARFASEHKDEPKTLYFEGAGCVPRGDVPNCRIRTAFHLDDGRAVYLELIGFEVAKHSPQYLKSFTNAASVASCHFIDGHIEGSDNRVPNAYSVNFEYSMTEILRFVNNLGASFDAIEVLPDLAGYRVFKEKHSYTSDGYNFGDEFQKDAELLKARETVNASIREKEMARGEKRPCYSLWVDHEDPAILHYHNCRTGEKFDICVDHPNDPDKLPTLHKSNAVVGAYYAGCGYLLKVYRITEEYAERYKLMYLDRCEVSSYGDIALPGSDVYRSQR